MVCKPGWENLLWIESPHTNPCLCSNTWSPVNGHLWIQGTGSQNPCPPSWHLCSHANRVWLPVPTANHSVVTSLLQETWHKETLEVQIFSFALWFQIWAKYGKFIKYCEHKQSYWLIKTFLQLTHAGLVLATLLQLS